MMNDTLWNNIVCHIYSSSGGNPKCVFNHPVLLQLTDVTPLVTDCGVAAIATAASNHPECCVKAVNFKQAGVCILLITKSQ